MYFSSINDIADDVIETFDESSFHAMRTIAFDKLHFMERLMQHITNAFFLWDAKHPLTSEWHQHDDLAYYPYHVAEQVVHDVWRKINE